MFTSPSDTLVIDTAKLQVWQQDADYDYGRELVPHQKSLMEWLGEQIEHYLDTLFGSSFYQENQVWIWTLVAVVLSLLFCWIVFVKRPAMFSRSGKVPASLDYDVTEDTIYGVDFSLEIEKALDRHDYREAVRLLYLQTLKILSDYHQIDWQPFKTPTQYTHEFRNADFLQLSRLFVKVRYGGFEAAEKMVEDMRLCQGNVKQVLSQLEEGGYHEK